MRLIFQLYPDEAAIEDFVNRPKLLSGAREDADRLEDTPLWHSSWIGDSLKRHYRLSQEFPEEYGSGFSPFFFAPVVLMCYFSAGSHSYPGGHRRESVVPQFEVPAFC